MAVALRAAEDRNYMVTRGEAELVGIGGRSPGRPRIGTASRCAPTASATPWWSPSGEKLRVAGDDDFLLITDLMSGCGMRNGEAAAVNINNIVADDIYRITEQVNQTTKLYDRLKHRKLGEYRDTPLPAHTRQTILWYADKHGTSPEGYLMRHPRDPSQTYPAYSLSNQWKRIKASGNVDIPEGLVIYSFRHYFASNCLSHGIPITDVAEWMGHRSLDITFKIYRHLIPGSIGRAAKMLNMGLAA
ncbi:tyrosine-type recombinase/integrase [Streptomyces sp. NPDC016469]|uniref:tyrosine-type recombinase/integrase n=1 Tax=Streptomyces sp. NPDC016469 TaxID=3157191 RepID=UPI0033E6FF34